MRRIFISVSLIYCVIFMPVTLACRTPVPQVSEAQQPLAIKKEDKSPLANLRSPYEIEKYINEHNDDADLREIWETFEIVRDVLKPVKCGCRGNDCPGICKAETIEIVSEGNEGYVLLRIGYWGETHRGFLLFKKENGWKYLGLAESVAMRYGPSQYKIVKNGDAQWLVIKELWGTGTGFLQYGERWYGLGDRGVKEVLSYPVSGHSVQGSTGDYLFKSTVIHRGKQEAFTVDVLYTEFGNAKYRNDREWLESRPRWRSSDKYIFRFIWDGATEKFVIDEKNSVLPKSKDDPILSGFSETNLSDNFWHRFKEEPITPPE
jgi:hypothetical protein